MRRNLLAVLALSAALAIGVAAIASAASTTLRVGNIVFTVGGNAKPSKLPANRYAPTKAQFFGKIRTSDGTHPSALRETVITIDKDVKLNVRGLPVCKSGQLQARDTKAAKRVCGKAIIGSGKATAEIAFAEQRPITVPSPILVFNAGGNAKKFKLLIHTFITVPVPAAIVTDVTVVKRGTGIKATARIPRISGGAGSALDYTLTVGRNYRYKGRKMAYSMAKCPDGKFRAATPRTVFKNETNEVGVAPQTILKGSILVPCQRRG